MLSPHTMASKAAKAVVRSTASPIASTSARSTAPPIASARRAQRSLSASVPPRRRAFASIAPDSVIPAELLPNAPAKAPLVVAPVEDALGLELELTGQSGGKEDVGRPIYLDAQVRRARAVLEADAA